MCVCVGSAVGVRNWLTDLQRLAPAGAILMSCHLKLDYVRIMSCVPYLLHVCGLTMFTLALPIQWTTYSKTSLRYSHYIYSQTSSERRGSLTLVGYLPWRGVMGCMCVFSFLFLVDAFLMQHDIVCPNKCEVTQLNVERETKRDSKDVSSIVSPVQITLGLTLPEILLIPLLHRLLSSFGTNSCVKKSKTKITLPDIAISRADDLWLAQRLVAV